MLEMKHQEPKISLWMNEQSPEEQKRLAAESYERDQLRKLVNDELARYGLLMQRAVTPSGNRWRTRANAHVLYGQLTKTGWVTRPVLCEGDFKECCVVAAKLLDELDASQVPDTETRPHET